MLNSLSHQFFVQAVPFLEATLPPCLTLPLAPSSPGLPPPQASASSGLLYLLIFLPLEFMLPEDRNLCSLVY